MTRKIDWSRTRGASSPSFVLLLILCVSDGVRISSRLDRWMDKSHEGIKPSYTNKEETSSNYSPRLEEDNVLEIDPETSEPPSTGTHPSSTLINYQGDTTGENVTKIDGDFVTDIRAALQSSISSWSVSNFNYAAIPSALPDYRDNVDYYFIDDSNATVTYNPRSSGHSTLSETRRYVETDPVIHASPHFSHLNRPNGTMSLESSTGSAITSSLSFTNSFERLGFSVSKDVIDSSVIGNDSKYAVTSRTPKLQTESTKEALDSDYRNEIKPSPTQRPPHTRVSFKPEVEIGQDSRMEYHHTDQSSQPSTLLRSSMDNPTSFYAVPSSEVKRKTGADEDATREARPAFNPDMVDEKKGNKTREWQSVLNMSHIPVSSNIIKDTFDVPKVIEPKEPIEFTTWAKNKPSLNHITSTFTEERKVLSTRLVTTKTAYRTPSLQHPSNTFNYEPASVSPSTFDGTTTKGTSLTEWNKKYPVLVNMTLSTTWNEFCEQIDTYKKTLTDILRGESKGSHPKSNQIYFLDAEDKCELIRERNGRSDREANISVFFLVQDGSGVYSQAMTRSVGDKLKLSIGDYNGAFRHKLVKVSLLTHAAPGETMDEEKDRLTQGILPFSNTSIITGIVLSVIAAFCLLSLCVILLVVKHRSVRHSASSTLPPHVVDGLNLDSFPGRGSTRRKRGRLSLRSFLNQAFDEPELPSHPLSFSSLTNAINNKTTLEEEFKKLPISAPNLEEVPAGAETKNRFSNVIPNPDTRVTLSPINNEPNSEYINANFVKGYGGKEKEYIATQAPLPDTVNDFWRMIWEQQCRMILMLTQFEENGANRCVPYFPDNTHDCNRAYGDFQVSLQSKDVRENFVVSTFKLYEIERNLFREVIHLWYTSWPAHKVPEDHSSILAFVLETRNHAVHRSSGPLVVHCSPGTGRTGAVIAMDILIKEYEESRVVDVQRCVSRLRQDRQGAVHTVQQYIVIHDVLHDFIVRLGTQSHRPSLKSLMSLKLH